MRGLPPRNEDCGGRSRVVGGRGSRGDRGRGGVGSAAQIGHPGCENGDFRGGGGGGGGYGGGSHCRQVRTSIWICWARKEKRKEGRRAAGRVVFIHSNRRGDLHMHGVSNDIFKDSGRLMQISAVAKFS